MASDNLLIRQGVIYDGCHIGNNLRTGHYALIREHCFIGNDVSIGSFTEIAHHVVIGHRVRIHSRCFVAEYTVLENDCWIGPGVIITNMKYPLSKKPLTPCLIRSGAKIGAGAIVLPGLEIGSNALVGAGSVVTRSVPAGAVVYGNPATVHGHVDDLGVYDG